ncbi:flavoprotein [bacterium BFN5]|nr:flavoprotein [bacterium BFN5]QJW46248.1 flavoprotein [bacterium BFN5]
MDTEALVQYLTGEVLKQLKNFEAGHAQSPAAGRSGKVLAIFTGGTIGLDQAMTELRSIQAIAAEITVVLSKAAEQIVGTAKIQENLGGHVQIVTSQSAYPGKILREADVVLVPVLTQNTAAKVAYTLADTMPSTMIMQALMLGKPVIAAENAADPHDDWRVKGNMGLSSPGLTQALKSNLQKVAEYGVKVVKVNCLAEQTRQVIGIESAAQVEPAVVPAAPAKKAVLAASTIKEAARRGDKTLTVAAGTVVTPLALDVAREYQIEVVFR